MTCASRGGGICVAREVTKIHEEFLQGFDFRRNSSFSVNTRHGR